MIDFSEYIKKTVKMTLKNDVVVNAFIVDCEDDSHPDSGAWEQVMEVYDIDDNEYDFYYESDIKEIEIVK